MLAVRTPDTFEYCRALGMDIEKWMKEGLIDIWITSGYFRLQEWDDIVKFSHRMMYPFGLPSMNRGSRTREQKRFGDLSSSRDERLRAGADSIWMFNYFHFPKDANFKLLKEAGDIDSLAFTNKVYVPDDLGRSMAKNFLKDGTSYFRRARAFMPDDVAVLKNGQTRVVGLRVGDDVGSATANGYNARVTLQLQVDKVPEDLTVKLNDGPLKHSTTRDGWIEFDVDPSRVKCDINQIVIERGDQPSDDLALKDLQLKVKYVSKTDTK